MTHGKSYALVNNNEKEHILIALGYGEIQVFHHKNKLIHKLADVKEDNPIWYKQGIETAMLAPTSMNQQKFYISRNGEEVTIKAKFAPLSKLDLGILTLQQLKHVGFLYTQTPNYTRKHRRLI